MINVMFLMNGAKPPRGGEYLTLNIIRNIDRKAFNPVVVYAGQGKIVTEIEQAGIETVGLNLPESLTQIYPRQTGLRNPLFIIKFAWLLIFCGCVFKVRKLIKERDIHLVYAADNLSKLVGGIAAKSAGVKIVAHCHDQFKEDSLGRIMRLFYILLLDKIIAVSHKVRDFFKVSKKGYAKTVTVYNGIDADYFDPAKVQANIRNELGLNHDTVVIGSVGILEPDKGHMYLLKALQKFQREKKFDIKCLICGQGPEEETLKQYVAEQGLAETVMFLGYRSDIREVLSSLDILVLTSLTIESFSLVAAEAMAMQIPLIATDVGGLPEVVGDVDARVIVPPADTEKLSEAMEQLIADPEKRKELGRKGRQRVLDLFTVTRNVKKTEEVFFELLNKEKT